MAASRIGIFGEYYGSLFSESETLSESEMKKNAYYIYSYFDSKNWTLNSCAAILGNMNAESAINPGRWQSDSVGDTANGYGLVQWTPATKYLDWCTAEGYSDPSEMDANLARIAYEIENGVQWISTEAFNNMTFEEFANSHESVSYLTKAFMISYERPADQSEEAQNNRALLGEKWLDYLSGLVPQPPSVLKQKKKYNFLLFQQRRRMKTWKRMNLSKQFKR